MLDETWKIGVDPRFPRGVVLTPKEGVCVWGGGGHQSIIRPNFPENCMNINEENWVKREGTRP